MCYQKIRKFRRKLILPSLLLFIVIYLLKKLLYPSIIDLAEYNKCPACYGTSVCQQLFNGQIRIQPFDYHTTMAHIVSSKNVFFGEFNGNKVVIKKLAHQDELEAFDKMICDEFLDCCADDKMKNKHHHKTDYFARILNDVSSDFINDDTSGLILCPDPENSGFFDKLQREFNYDNDIHLWTLVRINPEPIILQILRAEDGWPVPKFYGSCGRLCIEEYIGLPLTFYYNSPWILRAKIAVQLLKAARMLTFRDSAYSYYLTDMSPDNIAINRFYEPIFVDLENVIVVHKNTSQDNMRDFNDLHKSEETIDCKNCFVFSPLEICSHQISDHNYYAVCKHILSPESSATTIPGGFLYDVPKDISSRYPDLKIMIDQCSVPSGNKNRIQIADQLVDLLESIYQMYTETS